MPLWHIWGLSTLSLIYRSIYVFYTNNHVYGLSMCMYTSYIYTYIYIYIHIYIYTHIYIYIFPVTTFLGVRGEKITAKATATTFKLGKVSSFKFLAVSLG